MTQAQQSTTATARNGKQGVTPPATAITPIVPASIAPGEGFTDPLVSGSSEVHKHILNASGKAKASKTDWPLRTAPEPVWYICLDPNGLEIAKRLRASGRDIRIKYHNHKRPGEADQRTYIAGWNEFKRSWYAAINANKGTLVVDTGTEMYEECRLAHFGKVEQIRGRYYGPVNTDMKVLFRDLQVSSLSACIIHKLKKEWVNDASGEGRPTGNLVPAGWAEMEDGYAAQGNVELWRDDSVMAEWVKRGRPSTGWLDEKSGDWKFPFHLWIKEYSLDIGMSGTDNTTDQMTFAMMLMLSTGGLPE